MLLNKFSHLAGSRELDGSGNLLAVCKSWILVLMTSGTTENHRDVFKKYCRLFCNEFSFAVKLVRVFHYHVRDDDDPNTYYKVDELFGILPMEDVISLYEQESKKPEYCGMAVEYRRELMCLKEFAARRAKGLVCDHGSQKAFLDGLALKSPMVHLPWRKGV